MTQIPWATHTINPWVGCQHVSPACDNCYAEKMAVRLTSMFKYPSASGTAYRNAISMGKWTGGVGYKLASAKAQLDRIKGPASIFWCSMSDFFHEDVSSRHRDIVIGWMLKRTDLIHLLLTKRPDEAKRYYEYVINNAEEFDGIEPPDFTSQASHIWHGVTVENANCWDRIPSLLELPGPHFVSYEPLLSSTDACLSADWIVIGCEAVGGRPGRECKLQWVRDLVNQCLAACVPVMVKQIAIDGKLVRLEHEHGQERIAEALGFEPEQINRSVLEKYRK